MGERDLECDVLLVEPGHKVSRGQGALVFDEDALAFLMGTIGE